MYDRWDYRYQTIKQETYLANADVKVQYPSNVPWGYLT